MAVGRNGGRVGLLRGATRANVATSVRLDPTVPFSHRPGVFDGWVGLIWNAPHCLASRDVATDHCRVGEGKQPLMARISRMGKGDQMTNWDSLSFSSVKSVPSVAWQKRMLQWAITACKTQ